MRVGACPVIEEHALAMLRSRCCARARCLHDARSAESLPNVNRAWGLEAPAEISGAYDVTLNALPLTPASRYVFDRRVSARAGSHALFVNIDREATVVTDPLCEALRCRRSAAAAYDVTDPEPLSRSHPLRCLSNVALTRRIASIASAIGRPS